MIKMTEARTNYDAAITFYQKSLSMLRMASRKPNGWLGDARDQVPIPGDHGRGGLGPARQQGGCGSSPRTWPTPTPPRTAGGDPYRRQVPVFSRPGAEAPRACRWPRSTATRLRSRPSTTAIRPPTPRATSKLPNVDPLVEALDMKAQRAYEANLNVIETARVMDARTLDILKK
jgi:flagellar basal-body rod protein FlgC